MARKDKSSKDEENNIGRARDWGKKVDKDDRTVDKHRGRDDSVGDALKDVFGDDDA